METSIYNWTRSTTPSAIPSGEPDTTDHSGNIGAAVGILHRSYAMLASTGTELVQYNTST